jgi:hypothetical protein
MAFAAAKGSFTAGDDFAVPARAAAQSSLRGSSVSGGTIREFVRGGVRGALSLIAASLVVAHCAHGQDAWGPRAQDGPSQGRARAADVGGLFQLSGSAVTPYAQRQQLINSLPMDRLTGEARNRILDVANSPTLYRRLPTQAIDCDRDMFLFLSRNPEVLVGIWELMGITKVQTTRTGPFQFDASDGTGTQCHVDLIYGDPSMHIYLAEGSYDGKMVAKPIKGRGVFVLRSSYAEGATGRNTVTGTIDCFVQIENLGADLVARTLSGLIGRSADYNFVETARFMAQVSEASEINPSAMLDVATRIPQVSEATRAQFIQQISSLASKGSRRSVQTAERQTAARTFNTQAH